MRRASIFTLLGLLSAAFAAPDPKKDDKPATARPIEVTIPGATKGKATEPITITSAEDLAKAIGDEDAVTAIKKSVDFNKEQVVYFAWAGSGQDKLTIETKDGKKGPEIQFTYTRGLTRDLRQHKKVFALPKDATFTVATGK